MSRPGVDERAARIGLSCVIEPGEPEVAATVAEHGAAAVWAALRQGRLGAELATRAERVDTDVFLRQMAAGRFRFVGPGDPEWPAQLDDLGLGVSVQRRGGLPFGLWLRGPGRLDELAARSVSVVGSRASTSYGDTVATELAGDLAEQAVTVVSGGAFGIDAAAHRGALSVGGPTVAVLACGVDVSYPPAHRDLFGRIGADQVIVSELPPGAHPTRLRFLTRNRLIAALTCGTVIVEAALRSGARNTASWARECSRPLMAVPGPVHSALSVAPHLLIREQQATLVTTAADVLELISPVGQSLLPDSRGADRPTDRLDAGQLAVFEALPAGGYRTPGEIALLAGVSVPTCLAHLSALEEVDLVENNSRGWRIARQAARAR